MPTVAELLSQHSRLDLELRAGGRGARAISSVEAVDSLKAVASAAPGAMLILMRGATTGAAHYELDVAVRQAADHGLSGLVLVGRDDVPSTTLNLADRMRLPTLTADGACNVADLIHRIDRAIRGGPADVLARAAAAVEVLRDAAAPLGIEALVGAVSDALDREVGFAEDPAEAAGSAARTPVVLRGRQVGVLHATQADEAVALVLPALSAVVARLVEEEFALRFAPAQTRAELVSQILVAERRQLGVLAGRAREMGMYVESTHLAVWLNLRGGSSPEAARRLADDAELTALRSLEPGSGQWHVVRTGGDLLLLRTERTPAKDLPARVLARAQEVVAHLAGDEVAVYGGLGTAQPGADGLQQSAAEARAAADSAERAERPGTIGVFDERGLRRVLFELRASPFGGTLMELLAPLERRGREHALESVRTLAAVLDSQGSPRAAARTLHLHPNAVSYRMKRIAGDLDVDLTDADTRFAVHLACRLRLVDD